MKKTRLVQLIEARQKVEDLLEFRNKEGQRLVWVDAESGELWFSKDNRIKLENILDFAAWLAMLMKEIDYDFTVGSGQA
jgi:hypothetical protein